MAKLDSWEKKCLAEYEWQYLYACYLYYHGPADVESPLDDATFDRIQKVLQAWWQKTSPSFKKRVSATSLKTNAFAIELTPEEKAAAIAWAKSGDPH